MYSWCFSCSVHMFGVVIKGKEKRTLSMLYVYDVQVGRKGMVKADLAV